MSFATTQLAKIEALIAAHPGVKSFAVDGVQMTFEDLMRQRAELRREIQTETGTRPPIVPVVMGGI